MKYKILVSIMVLLALMMTGCVDEGEITADQETYGAVQSLLEEENVVSKEVIEVYNVSLDKCDKSILNKTIKLYENGEKIEVLQFTDGLKVNNNSYKSTFSHAIVIIPDGIEPRVNVVPHNVCGNDQSILIGDNPTKCKNTSEVLIFVDSQIALDLHFSGYYCPHIYYTQGVGKYYRFEILTDFNIVTSKLINEDFKQQELNNNEI